MESKRQRYSVRWYVSLAQLHQSWSAVEFLEQNLQFMRDKISNAIGLEISPFAVNLSIRPWPYEDSERHGHYDKLVPRTALELEMVTVEY